MINTSKGLLENSTEYRRPASESPTHSYNNSVFVSWTTLERHTPGATSHTVFDKRSAPTHFGMSTLCV